MANTEQKQAVAYGYDRLSPIRRNRRFRDVLLIAAGLCALVFGVLILDPMASGTPLRTGPTVTMGLITVMAAAFSWFFHLKYLGSKGT